MTRYRQKAGFATDFVHAPRNRTLRVGRTGGGFRGCEFGNVYNRETRSFVGP